MGPLLPTLRGQFASFLSHDSLEHLRILSFPTCVGLRYGSPYASRPVAFLAGLVTRAVRSPEGSRYCRLSARAYGLQPSVPSDGGGVTPRSRQDLHGECRNLHRLSIGCASRLLLRSRLTLSRLTLLRKPWVFGVNVPTFIVVTYAYIFFSGRSSLPHGTPSTLSAMLPYHTYFRTCPWLRRQS